MTEGSGTPAFIDMIGIPTDGRHAHMTPRAFDHLLAWRWKPPAKTVIPGADRLKLRQEVPASTQHKGAGMTEEAGEAKNPIDSLTDEERQEIVSDISDQLAKEDHELQFVLNSTLGFRDDLEGNNAPLTLLVDGAFISGLAITRSEWVKIHRKSFEKSVLLPHFDEEEEHLKSLRDQGHEVRDALEAATPPRKVIHMRDVQLRSGSQIVALPAMKVYIKRISAWSNVQVISN